MSGAGDKPLKSPGRFLFQLHNRRGMGHLMRGRNIAAEIRALRPSAEILFYTRSAPPAPWDPDIRLFVENPDRGSRWHDAVLSFSPDVLVYDTLLSGEIRCEPDSPFLRRVYVMRKSKESRQAEIFDNPALDWVDRIVIPHLPEEFSVDLPVSLQRKSIYVGPIVRLPRKETQSALKTKYRIAEGEYLLTSTTGGGGFADHAESFFETVFEVHRRLCPQMPNLRHLVVTGPNFKGSLRPLERMEIVSYEPDLIDLIALSDIVIAEGGYNTVNEIRLTKTPAVFLPSDRKFDDQEERVRSLEEKGLAFVFPERSSTVASEISRLCASASVLEQIRRNYESDRMVIGNRTAAEAIVECIDR
ncbi:hypothetical protein MNODULE_23730 [Nitrospiraceae bacterium HYJII51-Mn-bac16s-1-B09]|uniref:Glycosyl transferase family 28 C-terminal domain-containing protein n=1 Tax=Candidatus Manganitrophus noduliformans TaxID=2606439 RepID=A0A7X6IDZ5_9BACT|nr:hypothetical protein [Candidatus Manganitrophus noduliformans]